MSTENNNKDLYVIIIFSVIILSIILIILFSLNLSEDDFLKDLSGKLYIPFIR